MKTILAGFLFLLAIAYCSGPHAPKALSPDEAYVAELQEQKNEAQHVLEQSRRMGCGDRGFSRSKERVCEDGCNRFSHCACFTTYHEECSP